MKLLSVCLKIVEMNNNFHHPINLLLSDNFSVAEGFWKCRRQAKLLQLVMYVKTEAKEARGVKKTHPDPYSNRQ